MKGEIHHGAFSFKYFKLVKMFNCPGDDPIRYVLHRMKTNSNMYNIFYMGQTMTSVELYILRLIMIVADRDQSASFLAIAVSVIM